MKIKIKMSCFLLSRRCTHTSLNWAFRQTAIKGEIFASSGFNRSLARKVFPVHNINFMEKRNCSSNVFESKLATTQKNIAWFRASRNIDISSARFHGNIAKPRNISTGSHLLKNSKNFGEMRENKVFTVPNILCFGRILASPILAYFVIYENYLAALILFIAAGFTDMLDGFIARRFPSQMSYLGSVLDPIADKILVGVLTVSLSITHLIPAPLAVIILGRDIGLIFASFIVRFISLPQPRTLSRFFDFQLPTVQVTPSIIGKVNTALQLALISSSLAAPILDFTGHSYLLYLQYTVGLTTIVSGLDYFITRRGFSILGK